MLIEIVSNIINNLFAKILILISILMILSTIYSMIMPKRVKVKKRLAQQDSKYIVYADNFISKIEFLENIRNRVKINLGLITSKSENKNKLYATILMIFAFIFILAEFFLIIYFLNAPLFIEILLFIVSAILPYFFINIYIKSKKKQIYNDFPQLVSLFISKYASSNNIKESFRKCLDDIPKSLKHEIKRLINSMTTSEGYNTALDDFDARVDYTMCTAFVALIKGAYKTNTDIIENLMELENYISQERLESQRKVEQLRDKKWNLYFLMGSMVIAYFAMTKVFKEKAINFYWHTIEGQTVISACIIFSIIVIGALIIEDKI